MKTVLQRVRRAEVRVEDEVVAKIDRGILALVGVERGDCLADAHMTARKIAGLRIFPGRKPMDLNVSEVGGSVLVVSQFTLAGNVRKGRRPSFDRAEDPARAEPLYMAVADVLRERGVPTQTGRFAANMQVDLLNDGPVTLMIFTEGGVIL